MGWQSFIRGEIVCLAFPGQTYLSGLGRHWTKSLAVFRLCLLRCGPCCDTASASVKAHPVHVAIHNDGAIDISVANDSSIYMDDRSVVAERITPPATATEADTSIAETVIDTAVEAYCWTPVAFMKEVDAISPTPIAWCPKKAHGWSHHPRARNPVISIGSPSPKTGSPHVVRSGT